MREFQEQCIAALRPALGVLEVEPRWQSVECQPHEGMGYVAGDVYCRATFQHAGHAYDLYVYTEDAGAYVDGRWFIYEQPDCHSDDRELMTTFARFIQLCISGVPAKKAYKAARRGS